MGDEEGPDLHQEVVKAFGRNGIEIMNENG